jgi:hypothetical protein
VRGPAERPFGWSRLGSLAAIALCVALAAVVVWGFVEGRQEAAVEAERETPIKPPLRVKLQPQGEPVVTFDAAAQKAIDLQTIAPAPSAYHDQVRAYGTVLDLAALTTLNTTYAAAVSQLNTAQAQLAASLPAYERAQTLYAKRIGSLAQMQTAEAAVFSDKAAVSAAQSLVRTTAATAIQEWGPVIGTSLVNAGGLVMRLIERKEFLLQLTLPAGLTIDPPPLASAEVGSSARRAEVRYISPATRSDPRIQGFSYFYAAAANSGFLPGMNVRAYLASDKPMDGYTIPSSAIVWWSGRAWVYERIEEDAFTRREVPTDVPAGDDGAGFVVPVRALPQPKPQIVVKGAQLLLSEEFRAQIQVEGDDD